MNKKTIVFICIVLALVSFTFIFFAYDGPTHKIEDTPIQNNAKTDASNDAIHDTPKDTAQYDPDLPPIRHDSQMKESTVDVKKFWEIIDKAKNRNKDLCLARSKEGLSQLTPAEILQFEHIAAVYMDMANTPQMHMACKVMNGNAKEDTFLYFTLWSISQGHDVFMRALQDPDSLSEIDIDMREANLEKWMTIPTEVLKEKGIDPLKYSSDMTLTDDQMSEILKDAPVPSESSFDELKMIEMLPKTVPKLYKKYWHLRTPEEIKSDDQMIEMSKNRGKNKKK